MVRGPLLLLLALAAVSPARAQTPPPPSPLDAPDDTLGDPLGTDPLDAAPLETDATEHDAADDDDIPSETPASPGSATPPAPAVDKTPPPAPPPPGDCAPPEPTRRVRWERVVSSHTTALEADGEVLPVFGETGVRLDGRSFYDHVGRDDLGDTWERNGWVRNGLVYGGGTWLATMVPTLLYLDLIAGPYLALAFFVTGSGGDPLPVVVGLLAGFGVVNASCCAIGVAPIAIGLGLDVEPWTDTEKRAAADAFNRCGRVPDPLDARRPTRPVRRALAALAPLSFDVE